jgi:hypothetical protein
MSWPPPPCPDHHLHKQSLHLSYCRHFIYTFIYEIDRHCRWGWRKLCSE